jgi:1-pyrroline-5-carboxylate dehydrogenase
VLGRFPLGSARDVERATAAAERALRRLALHAARRAAAARASSRPRLIEERVYQIAAALALEVGKNRMEALGEAQETADFFTGYADELERAAGYDQPLPDDPLPGFRSRNRSVLKPHGVWGVIVPFNFPLALAGGPVAAALVTGNTVVLKGATDTPWAGRLLADCIRDAGFPPGVFNYVTGQGRVVGEALVADKHLAGVTFTGSYDVGNGAPAPDDERALATPLHRRDGGQERLHRDGARRSGARGDRHRALGLRSHRPEVLGAVAPLRRGSRRGRPAREARGADPRDPDGRPVPPRELDGAGHQRGRGWTATRSTACGSRRAAGASSRAAGGSATGRARARPLRGAHARGGAARASALPGGDVPADPDGRSRRGRGARAWALANQSALGLTAGCYGGAEDVRYFLDHIEAGVTYVNRPQGATTGAWPFYQPFGGWKGSGSTGKAIGSSHYLPLYLREQSQTVVE